MVTKNIPFCLILTNQFCSHRVHVYKVFAELEAGKNPRQTIEKYKLSPKWFGKIMKAYLAQIK